MMWSGPSVTGEEVFWKKSKAKCPGDSKKECPPVSAEGAGAGTAGAAASPVAQEKLLDSAVARSTRDRTRRAARCMQPVRDTYSRPYLYLDTETTLSPHSWSQGPTWLSASG